MNASSLTCILIPVHNRRELTLACLDGLAWCATDASYRIVVIDDGSTDGTGDAICAAHPQVQVLNGTGDLFWTGAMRLGMKSQSDQGITEWLWLNDDTVPSESTTRKIVDRVRSHPDKMIGASPHVDSVPTAFSSLNRIGVIAHPGEQQRVDVLAGFMVAFSAAVVDRIGLPDADRFPHYAGDSSYTRTAHNAGFELWIDGDAPLDLARFEPYPTLAEAFWKRPDRTFRQRLEQTFLSKRSKFRLRTQWHLDRLYRGSLMGTAAFIARCVLWAWQIPTSSHRHTPSGASRLPRHA